MILSISYNATIGQINKSIIKQIMKNLEKLAKTFNLEEYVDYKIENGSIYIIQYDNFDRKFWLYFGNTTMYRKNYIEMFKDIAQELKNNN
jgi:hypothetical protein